jgi:hypothetical protein
MVRFFFLEKSTILFASAICGCVWLAGKNWRRGLFLQSRGPVDLEFGSRFGVSLERY